MLTAPPHKGAQTDLSATDCLSKDAATRLAATIERYWLDEGYEGIRTAVVPFPIPWRLRRTGDEPQGYRVVSNIGPNGYPPIGG